MFTDMKLLQNKLKIFNKKEYKINTDKLYAF